MPEAIADQETKAATLAAYPEMSPKTDDAELRSLLLGGEGPRVEFKSTLRWDLKENRKNPGLEKAVVKTVAGLLNAEGGTLLLGVADDGTPVGLERDYATFSKPNRDGFELHLTNLLLDSLGRDLAPRARCSFGRVDNHDVCRLEIARSPRPVLVKEGNADLFYLRTGNSTRRLSIREVLDYHKERWPASNRLSAGGPSSPPNPFKAALETDPAVVEAHFGALVAADWTEADERFWEEMRDLQDELENAGRFGGSAHTLGRKRVCQRDVRLRAELLERRAGEVLRSVGGTVSHQLGERIREAALRRLAAHIEDIEEKLDDSGKIGRYPPLGRPDLPKQEAVAALDAKLSILLAQGGGSGRS